MDELPFKREHIRHNSDINDDGDNEQTLLIKKDPTIQQIKSKQNGFKLTSKELYQLNTAAFTGTTGLIGGMLMGGPIGAIIGVTVATWGGVGAASVVHDNQSEKHQQASLKKNKQD